MQNTPSAQKQSGVQYCLQQIRQMILSGELLPGEKVRQGDIAERLNVSRIPVREALSSLHAEGVLTHQPRTGYNVARFSADDLSELYLMRRLLETELLRSIDLSAVDVDELEMIDRRLAKISPIDQPDEYQDTNREFHFRLFEYSPLALVRHEVGRLWYRSSYYRSLYLHEAGSALEVSHDHDVIMRAVREGDREGLISASDRHRSSTENLVIRRLGRSRPR